MIKYYAAGAGIGAAFLLGLWVGFVGGSGRADERARIANAEATLAADKLVAAQEVADLALEAHRLAVIELDTIAAGRTRAELRLKAIKAQRVPLPAAVPDTCQPFAVEITRLALEVKDLESIVKADSAIVETLREDNTRLAGALQSARQTLMASEAELRRQATRTERTPKKLLGLVPMPSITVGYGATLLAGRVQTGPQATVGWKVAL